MKKRFVLIMELLSSFIVLGDTDDKEATLEEAWGNTPINHILWDRETGKFYMRLDATRMGGISDDGAQHILSRLVNGEEYLDGSTPAEPAPTATT